MKKKIVSLKCFLRQHKEIGFHNVLRLNRIHGVISRVLLGRGSNITDSLQRSLFVLILLIFLLAGPTDGPTDGPKD